MILFVAARCRWVERAALSRLGVLKADRRTRRCVIGMRCDELMESGWPVGGRIDTEPWCGDLPKMIPITPPTETQRHRASTSGIVVRRSFPSVRADSMRTPNPGCRSAYDQHDVHDADSGERAGDSAADCAELHRHHRERWPAAAFKSIPWLRAHVKRRVQRAGA